jgi:hypothetical protein
MACLVEEKEGEGESSLYLRFPGWFAVHFRSDLSAFSPSPASFPLHIETLNASPIA